MPPGRFRSLPGGAPVPMERDAEQAARDEGQEVEEAKKEIHALEQGDPPEKLEDWPDGRAKYLTYGGPEGTAGYDEGPTRKLGPSSLEHHEDGSVSIEGEKVDDPEEFKGEPLPGSPGARSRHRRSRAPRSRRPRAAGGAARRAAGAPSRG